jgi:hypothetical protein
MDVLIDKNKSLLARHIRVDKTASGMDELV